VIKPGSGCPRVEQAIDPADRLLRSLLKALDPALDAVIVGISRTSPRLGVTADCVRPPSATPRMPGLLHAIAFVIGSAPANSPSTGSHFGCSYADAPRNETPQARAESCRLPSAPARYTLGQAAEDAAAEELKRLRVRSMAEISMVVTSIDPLAGWLSTIRAYRR